MKSSKHVHHLFLLLATMTLCLVHHDLVAVAKPGFVPIHVSPRQLKLKHARRTAVISQEHACTTDTTSTPGPLVEVALDQLKLPRMAVGKAPVAIPLQIQDKGPFEFMLDTGLTAQIISPRLKDLLEFDTHDDAGSKTQGNIKEGLAAGGSTGNIKLVNLSGVKLHDKNQDLKLPTLQGVVTHFAQENMDRKHPVTGMLGMETMQLFDVDLDFPAGKLRLWAPGTAVKEAKRLGLVEIPTVVVNESLLLGTRITGVKAGGGKQTTNASVGSKQPFIGIVDSGSTFSAVNWEAAKLLGLPSKNSLIYLKPPAIMAVGIDGKPLYLPTIKLELTFCGNGVVNDKGELLGFASPSAEWKPWDPVLVGIGDLPIFELLLGNKKNPFRGPAGLIGMDILSQRRIILESSRNEDISASTERRVGRMFVEAT